MTKANVFATNKSGVIKNGETKSNEREKVTTVCDLRDGKKTNK